MIEIILREDVSNYETKPLFGFTYRQAGAVAVCAVVSYFVWIGLTSIGVPVPIIGFIIVALGVIIACCFLVKIQGMYANKRLPILLKYNKRPKTVFAQNAVYIYDKPQQEKSKKELKQEAKLRKQALKESEFCDKDGRGVSRKQYLKLLYAEHPELKEIHKQREREIKLAQKAQKKAKDVKPDKKALKQEQKKAKELAKNQAKIDKQKNKEQKKQAKKEGKNAKKEK